MKQDLSEYSISRFFMMLELLFFHSFKSPEEEARIEMELFEGKTVLPY